MPNYTLKIAALRQETADTVTVCFKQPALKKIKYQPGQYLSLVFRINGRRYVRPYSFSSAPGVDPFLEVTVKRVPGGIVSNHICDKINVDDLVEVMEPMGDFVISETLTAGNPHVFLWGAGSGITPLFSITKYLLNNTNVKVTLVYGNKNAEAVIFHHQLKTLQAQFSDTFSIWHFHSQQVVKKGNPDITQGRIKAGEVLSVMAAKGDILNSLHYICGPVGLKESVRAELSTLTIGSSNIFTEDFELVKDEKELAEVITRSVKIVKDGQTVVLEVTKGKSILEAGLDALIELPYSCQVGNCLLCMGKITGGKVKYAGIKPPAEIKEPEYLLCCTYPLSDDVEVNIE